MPTQRMHALSPKRSGNGTASHDKASKEASNQASKRAPLDWTLQLVKVSHQFRHVLEQQVVDDLRTMACMHRTHRNNHVVTQGTNRRNRQHHRQERLPSTNQPPPPPPPPPRCADVAAMHSKHACTFHALRTLARVTLYAHTQATPAVRTFHVPVVWELRVYLPTTCSSNGSQKA